MLCLHVFVFVTYFYAYNCFNEIINILAFMFIPLLLIPTEDEAGEVDIGKVGMSCGKMRWLLKDNQPVVIIFQVCLMVMLCLMLIDMLCSYYYHIMLLIFLLCFL